MLSVSEAIRHLVTLVTETFKFGTLLQVALVGRASSGKTTVIRTVHEQTNHTELVYCAMYSSLSELELQILSSLRSSIVLLEDCCLFDCGALMRFLKRFGISFVLTSRLPVHEACDTVVLQTPATVSVATNENILSFCTPTPVYCQHMTRAQCTLLTILHICMHSNPSQDAYRFGKTTVQRKGTVKRDQGRAAAEQRPRASRVPMTRLKACLQAYYHLQGPRAVSATASDDITYLVASLVDAHCIACTRGPTQSKTYLQCLLTTNELAAVRAKAGMTNFDD